MNFTSLLHRKRLQRGGSGVEEAPGERVRSKCDFISLTVEKERDQSGFINVLVDGYLLRKCLAPSCGLYLSSADMKHKAHSKKSP